MFCSFLLITVVYCWLVVIILIIDSYFGTSKHECNLFILISSSSLLLVCYHLYIISFFHGCLFIMNYFHIFQPLLLSVYDSLFFFFDFDLLLLFSFIYFSIVIMIIIFWDLKRGHHRHHHHHHHHHHHVISVYHFIWFSFVCLHLLRLCCFQIGNNQAIKLLDLLCVLVSYRSFTLWNNQLRKQFRSRMGFCSWQVAGLLLSVPFQQDVFIA